MKIRLPASLRCRPRRAIPQSSGSCWPCVRRHFRGALHITTGADNTNNVLALGFDLLIVFLVTGGLLWIMSNLNHNMMPMDQIMQMQR